MRANPHYAPREGAEAIPFRPGDDRSREIVTVPRDASYEHALDQDAPGERPGPRRRRHRPPALGGERLLVIPEHLQTWEGMRATLGKYLDADPVPHPNFYHIK